MTAARRWFGGWGWWAPRAPCMGSRELHCPWEEARGKEVKRRGKRGKGGLWYHSSLRSCQALLHYCRSTTHPSTDCIGTTRWAIKHNTSSSSLLVEAVNLCLVASLDLCVKLHVSFCSQVAHPPGYPLFTLVARMAMCLLPSLSPAHSVNLMCSLLGAAACGALCISVCR